MDSYPEKIKFLVIKKFKYKGYDCIIRQNSSLKYLLGYVKLPKGHKYYKVPKEKIPVRCHYGLTYGEIEGDFYVIGLDCAHGCDFDCETKFNPKYPLGKPNKDKNFVIDNIKNIVDQLEE